MKKQDRKRDRWLLRQRAKKARNKQRRTRARRHGFRPALGPLLNQHNKEQNQPAEKRIEIELPETLDLEANYERTVTDLTNVRRAALRGLRGYRLRYLNFDKIKTISPSAALVLASEIDRWNASVGGRLRARHEGWDAHVKKLLCEMGFFSLLGIEQPGDAGPTVNTTFLPFLRGNIEEKTDAGQLAKQLRQEIEKIAGIEIKRHLLYDGLTEAVTNVSHHAYLKKSRRRKRFRGRYRPWWMSAAIEKNTNTVTVSFYDHGLTIPGTLLASEKMERWKHRLGLWDDGQKIRAAMTLGRSATGKAGRGKGLTEFDDIARFFMWNRADNREYWRLDE